MAAINSLGIGSGVLTADVLDQLRKADEANIINPIARKIESNQLKLQAFDMLNTLMGSFQNSVSNLSMGSLFLARSVSGNTDAVNVTATDGSDVQSFTLSDVLTARGEVTHSTATIASKTTTVAPNAPGNGQLTLTIGTKSHTINYGPTTTLEQLASAINETAGADVTASILQVGTDKYELVLKSDSVGANQTISLSDSWNDGTNDANSLLTSLGMSTIQTARDASFKYNGIAIARSTNEISDLLNGVTISLKQDQPVGTQASIAISQNKTEISTEMSLLVQNYNALITNISDMTAYDKEAGKVGVFNGDNFIKSIGREITRLLSSVDGEGNSLVDYGISFDKSGKMSLDTTAFEAKMAENPVSLEAFFSGTVEGSIEKPGIFDTLYEQMQKYTGHEKQFDTYKSNLNKTLSKLNTDKETMTKRLDDRYEIMTKRFAAYDSLISKLNSQFSSLQQMISAQLNQSKS